MNSITCALNSLGPREWIMLMSATVIALGWFVTGKVNRDKDIALKRLDFRLKALEAYLPVRFSVQDMPDKYISNASFIENLELARVQIHLYGLADEIEAIERIVKAVNMSDTLKADSEIESTTDLVRKRIRAELQIKTP